MADKGKLIGLSFVVIIVALGAGIVVPELFANLVNQQNGSNQPVMSSMRILIMVFIVFVTFGSIGVFVGEIDI